jgi:manganese oxidase
MNGKSPMGGIMTTIEYSEAGAKGQSFYTWKNKKFIPDFYYEESLKKPLGFYDNPAFKGKPAP